MRIGILTGGGDVPGLNPCIKAVVNRGRRRPRSDWHRRGWGGLLELNRDDPASIDQNTIRLDKNVVARLIERAARSCHEPHQSWQGAPEGCTRFPEGPGTPGGGGAGRPPRDFTPHVLKNLEYLGIDRLIPIGGDDTLSYGERLHSETFPVIAIPKTMDNDGYGTDYCIGFSTAGRAVHPPVAHEHGFARAHRRGRAVRRTAARPA